MYLFAETSAPSQPTTDDPSSLDHSANSHRRMPTEVRNTADNIGLRLDMLHRVENFVANLQNLQTLLHDTIMIVDGSF